MTNHPLMIVKNCALALPLGVVAGALYGAEHALAAGLSSLVLLANLWALSVLGPRVVHSLARGESPVFWMVAIGAKFVLLMAIFLGLVRVLPAIGLAMGFVPLIVGTLATGIVLGLAEAAAEEG